MTKNTKTYEVRARSYEAAAEKAFKEAGLEMEGATILTSGRRKCDHEFILVRDANCVRIAEAAIAQRTSRQEPYKVAVKLFETKLNADTADEREAATSAPVEEPKPAPVAEEPEGPAILTEGHVSSIQDAWTPGVVVEAVSKAMDAPMRNGSWQSFRPKGSPRWPDEKPCSIVTYTAAEAMHPTAGSAIARITYTTEYGPILDARGDRTEHTSADVVIYDNSPARGADPNTVWFEERGKAAWRRTLHYEVPGELGALFSVAIRTNGMEAGITADMPEDLGGKLVAWYWMDEGSWEIRIRGGRSRSRGSVVDIPADAPDRHSVEKVLGIMQKMYRLAREEVAAA